MLASMLYKCMCRINENFEIRLFSIVEIARPFSKTSQNGNDDCDNEMDCNYVPKIKLHIELQKLCEISILLNVFDQFEFSTCCVL